MIKETKRKRSAAGVLLLLLSWIAGVGGLNLGLLREDANVLASSVFVAACVIWLAAYRLLGDTDRVGRWIAGAVIGFWILNLVFAFAVGREAVYKTSFFSVSIVGTIVVIALARTVLSPDPKRKARNG